MKLFLAQINNIVGDIDGNLKRAIDILDQAEELNSDLVVFSELFLSGYPPEDLVLKKSFVEECRNALDTLINYSKTKKIGLIVGLPIYEKNNLFNAAAIAICHNDVPYFICPNILFFAIFCPKIPFLGFDSVSVP